MKTKTVITMCIRRVISHVTDRDVLQMLLLRLHFSLQQPGQRFPRSLDASCVTQRFRCRVLKRSDANCENERQSDAAHQKQWH